jgi:hypothetical protein
MALAIHSHQNQCEHSSELPTSHIPFSTGDNPKIDPSSKSDRSETVATDLKSQSATITEFAKEIAISRLLFTSIKKGNIITTTEDEYVFGDLIRAAIFTCAEAKTVEEFEAGKKQYNDSLLQFGVTCPDFCESLRVSDPQWEFVRHILVPMILDSRCAH